MCGVYAIFQHEKGLNAGDVSHLARTAQARGVDSAGLIFQAERDIQVKKRDYGSVELIKDTGGYLTSSFIAGHSRLVTNDVSNNQPVIKDDLIVIHNGIITNYLKIWELLGLEAETELDSEVIPALFEHFSKKGLSEDDAVQEIFNVCEGVISAILIAPKEIINKQSFNVGIINGNYTVKKMAETAKSLISGSEIIYSNNHKTDERTYKVSFNKIYTGNWQYLIWGVERGSKLQRICA